MGETNPKSLVPMVVGVPSAKWDGWGVGRDPVKFRSDWLLGSLPFGMTDLGRMCKLEWCHGGRWEVWDLWDCALSAQLHFGTSGKESEILA